MTLQVTQQKLLDQFVEKLRAVADANLDSVVLYGTSAGGDFHVGYSDLNLLCLFKSLETQALTALAPVMQWWARSGQPQPMLLELDELKASVDVFAIEMMDIKSRHRILHGLDRFAELDIPMDLHRIQLEHELRTNLLRIRSHFIFVSKDKNKIMDLMTSSVSSFTTLFRHALIALGEQPALHRREAVERLSVLLQFDAVPVLEVLDVRTGELETGKINTMELFQGYLNAIVQVTHEVDRRLAA